MAIVDAEPARHAAARQALGDVSFRGRAVHLVGASDEPAARRLLADEPDVAVVILPTATGLEALAVARYLRDELDNRQTRIVVRAEPAGQATDAELLAAYDVCDFADDLTAPRLARAVIMALRAYEAAVTMRDLAATNAALTRLAGDGMYVGDPDSGHLVCSALLRDLLGVPGGATPTYAQFIRAIPADARDVIEDAIRGATATGRPYDLEHTLIGADGRRATVRHRGEARARADATTRLVGIVQDVTEQHAAAALARQFAAAVEQTADAVMITDRHGVIEWVNAAFVAMTGYARDEIVGQQPSVLRSGRQPATFYQRMWKVILQGDEFSDILINRRRDGTLYYEAKTITPHRGPDGEITHFISTGKDITDRMQAQERLHHVANHDVLTGLPNRMLMMVRLGEAIARARADGGQVAMLLLDLDRFKVINDTLGHDAGDRLLELMASRLTHCVGAAATVARLGGDEFALVLGAVTSTDDVVRVAQAVLDAAKAPFVVDDRELFVTTSIGISVFPSDGDDGPALVKRADVALYSAKLGGKNGFRRFTERDEARALERLSLETELRRALERGEFFLLYQPQVDARTGAIDGAEALLRWRRPGGAIVPPLEFIPLLEETGMIVDVGDWVLEAACAQAQAMRQAGLAATRIAVNISAHQLRHKGFARRIRDLLRDTELPPALLELEVTEGVLIDDIAGTIAVLDELRAVGVRLSLDDFGTGYSSIHYLKRLPFDVLKIDKSFVQGVPYSRDDVAIVTTIVALAHSLNLQVVAEGVETDAQFEFVRAAGCHAVQGFRFGRPLDAAALARQVAAGGGPPSSAD